MKKKAAQKIKAISKSHKIKGYFDPIEVLKNYDKNQAILLESADVVTKLGEKSMLLLDLALKIEARHNLITVTVLIDEARALLDHLSIVFAERIVDKTTDQLTISIDPLYEEADLIKKLSSPSALDILRASLKLLGPSNAKGKSSLMLSGVFSYDFLDHFEALPPAQKDELKLPDFLFYLPLSIVMLEHKNNQISIATHALAMDDETSALNNIETRLAKTQSLVDDAIRKSSSVRSLPPAIRKLDAKSYKVDVPDEDFGHLIDQCMEHIKAGDVYQIVPSRTFSRSIDDPLACYKTLRNMNPSPYMFYVRTADWTLFGASPETFIKVDKQGTRVSVRPIAGTRRRGLNEHGQIDDELDSREQASLCLDEKELAEHMMLVDLARNDIASVAEPRTRFIKRLMGVDRFSHVMHLVSEVEGRLGKGFDALSAYQASMNMGTLMGAPKVKAAEILRKLEWSKRGFYGGALGYINAQGDMDTAIIIRSAVVKNGHAYVRAGCGVVYDSNRAFETQETVNKAEAVLKAIELASAS